jgi:hypothetical protein
MPSNYNPDTPAGRHHRPCAWLSQFRCPTVVLSEFQGDNTHLHSNFLIFLRSDKLYKKTPAYGNELYGLGRVGPLVGCEGKLAKGASTSAC